MKSTLGSTSIAAEPKLGPRVTNELIVQKFNNTATNISGTATNLHATLAELEAELKQDLAGKKEYEAYQSTTLKKRAELQKRVDANKVWISNFEKNDNAGAFEAQYKTLISEIGNIYNTAKESHASGIKLLEKDFNYHAAFKRWNDTFSATAFTPK